MAIDAIVRGVESEARAYRPRWWYLAAAGGFGLAGIAALSAVIAVDSTLWIAVPLAAAWSAWSVGRITLGPRGLSNGRRVTPWEEVDLISTRWGETLLTHPGSFSGRRGRVLLQIYDRSWRTGPLGTDIERWAPKLLDGPPYEGPDKEAT